MFEQHAKLAVVVRGVFAGCLTMLALGVLTPSVARAGNAQTAPWCMQQPANGQDCSYFSFDQCYDAARGVTNQCFRNPIVSEFTPVRRNRARVRG